MKCLSRIVGGAIVSRATLSVSSRSTRATDVMVHWKQNEPYPSILCLVHPLQRNNPLHNSPKLAARALYATPGTVQRPARTPVKYLNSDFPFEAPPFIGRNDISTDCPTTAAGYSPPKLSRIRAESTDAALTCSRLPPCCLHHDDRRVRRPRSSSPNSHAEQQGRIKTDRLMDQPRAVSEEACVCS